MDFGDEEIAQFAYQWTGAVARAAHGRTERAVFDAAQEETDLLAAIHKNPGVYRLATNPLMLTILAVMKRQDVVLPERRVELYEQYVKTMLKHWNLARGLGQRPARDLDVVETVRVLAPALVLREPLPAGGTITQARLVIAEVDWADEPDAPLADAAVLHGRRLARPLAAGASLRPTDLQPLRWFEAGARVRIDAVGRGWRVSGSGQALQAGLDGRRVRVRTDGGRIVSGIAVAVGRVEVAL